MGKFPSGCGAVYAQNVEREYIYNLEAACAKNLLGEERASVYEYSVDAGQYYYPLFFLWPLQFSNSSSKGTASKSLL